MSKKKGVRKVVSVRSGKGTHGSLTKAGRVRENTPFKAKTNLDKKLIPRIANRKKYIKLLEKKKRGI